MSNLQQRLQKVKKANGKFGTPKTLSVENLEESPEALILARMLQECLSKKLLVNSFHSIVAVDMPDDDIVFVYEDGDDNNEAFYLDDETSEYLLHPVRSHMINCFKGVTVSLYPLMTKLILFAFLRRILVFLNSKGVLARSLLDTGIVICGLLLLKLQNNVGSQTVVFLGGIISFYFLKPFVSSYVGYCSLIYGLFCLSLCQYLYVPELFMSSRGCFMVMVMKFASLFFDLENGTVDSIHFLQFSAYLLDPITLLFGPWISYAEFSSSLQYSSLKRLAVDVLFGLLIMAASFVFALFSTCGSEILYPDNWLVSAYATAQSFRFSHYFIAWLSYGIAEFSGCGCGIVSRWWRVEFPRSLVEVVVSWDLPMHRFLRKYVFSEFRHLGILPAVLMTYIFSSLLHLSAVLLSLGLITFVETRLRSKLSRKFSACISVNECSSVCKHHYKKDSVLTIALNTVFRFLAIYHLIYLGMIFDDSSATTGYSMAHTLKVWSSWKYSSHLITLFLYTVVLLI